MTSTRTELLIETSEFFIVRRKRWFVRTWCEGCGREVNMTSPREAALMLCEHSEAIHALIERNNVHSRLLHDEKLYVCLRSLCRALS